MRYDATFSPYLLEAAKLAKIPHSIKPPLKTCRWRIPTCLSGESFTSGFNLYSYRIKFLEIGLTETRTTERYTLIVIVHV